MTCRRLTFLFLLICIPAAQAALPRDAGFRQKEIYTHRQQKIAEYEKAKQNREDGLVSRDRTIRQELARPPWGATAGPASAVKMNAPRSEAHHGGRGQNEHKWGVSLIILLCLGGWVWWVRSKTEPHLPGRQK